MSSASGEESIGPGSQIPDELTLEQQLEAAEWEAYQEQMRLDEERLGQQEEAMWDATSIVLFAIISIWFLATVFQSGVTVYNWFRTSDKEGKNGRKWKVAIYVLVATLMGVCVLLMKLMNILIHFYVAMVCYSNLVSLYLLPHIFDLTTDSLPGYDATTARLRATFVILGVLNLVCVAASVSDHPIVGGRCQEDNIIPYLMDVMLLMQAAAHLIVCIEHWCGYGRINPKSPEARGEVEDENSRRKKTEKSTQEGVVLLEMTSFHFRWSLLMIVLKLSLVALDMLWVTQKNVYYCDQAQEVLIYVDSLGTVYWALFSLQILLVINMVNVVLYEGGMKAALFGGKDGPQSTICIYIWTCCQWDTEEIQKDFEEDDRFPKHRVGGSAYDEDDGSDGLEAQSKGSKGTSKYSSPAARNLNANDETGLASTGGKRRLGDRA